MERQYKNDAELRDREFQLRQEEMAIAREDARAQRQMMNLMIMSMMNRNLGGGADIIGDGMGNVGDGMGNGGEGI